MSSRAEAVDFVKLLYDVRERFPMFVVYDHPTDHPDHYLARLWLTLPAPAEATNIAIGSQNLGTLQGALEALGLVKLMRQEGDAPVILETWI